MTDETAPALPTAIETAESIPPALAASEPKAAKKPVAPRKPAIPTAAAPAEPQKEIVMTDTIDTVVEKTADKTTAFAGEMNERAKTAMEKGTQAFEKIVAFNKGNVEAMIESGKIAARGAEAMGQDAVAYAKRSYEASTEAAKMLARTTSPTEFFKLQGDYARQAFDTMVAESARSTEKMVKLAGEIAQPIQNRIAVATATLKAAA